MIQINLSQLKYHPHYCPAYFFIEASDYTSPSPKQVIFLEFFIFTTVYLNRVPRVWD